jgi:hypothetical protein
MGENALPAIVALVGVIVSVAASLVVSMRQFRVEAEKLRNEYVHLYAEKLFDKRIAVYREISERVIAVIQRINLQREVDPGELKRLSNVLLEWNVRNAFLLSAKTEQIMHRLYIDLDQVTDEARENLVRDAIGLEAIKHRLLEFYLALKGELGIYGLVSPSDVTGFRTPGAIREVAELAVSGE